MEYSRLWTDTELLTEIQRHLDVLRREEFQHIYGARKEGSVVHSMIDHLRRSKRLRSLLRKDVDHIRATVQHQFAGATSEECKRLERRYKPEIENRVEMVRMLSRWIDSFDEL